jgi:hypothetical protein
LRYQRVRREQRNTFDHRLRDEDSIEWVFMEKRQSINCECVVTADQQLAVTVVQQSSTQQSRIRLKVASPKSSLDGNLPKAGGAEHEFIPGIVHQLPGSGRQPTRFFRSPKEQVRIKE